MMRSLYTGVSGLKTHQTGMDVIGNNISNVNTTGFKAGRATFADIFSQTLNRASSPNENIGSTNPKQIGLGTNVSAIDLMFNNGALLSTGKNTDLGISGDGLFVVQHGTDTYYTRNGGFEFDADGNYVLPGSGHFVQGWTANDGVINTSGAVVNIQVQLGKTMTAKATDTVNYLDNLNSQVTMIANVSGGVATSAGTVASETNPVILTFSDGSSVMETEGTYQVGNSLPVTTSTTIYDSTGATHEVPVYFIREGESNNGVISSTNKWLVSLSPNSAVKKGDATTAEFVDANGNKVTATLNVPEIQFDTAGNIVTDSANLDTMGTMSLNYTANTSTTAPTAQNVKLDFTGLTQNAGSTTIDSSGNGNAEGILRNIQIDSSGMITGVYTNGINRPEAQVAVAHFTNAQGLLKTGSSMYQQSSNSGVPVIDTSDKIGVVISPGFLEMSNVDVANEFANMIITQRGFQANSKVITVDDEMISTAVNMKQ